MKILLLGHKGYLGSYLRSQLKADVLDSGRRKIYSNNRTYDYVINCIGKPDLEYCENHPDETDYCNYLVIRDINKYYPTSKIINFSSYYVYDSMGLCTENSRTTTKYRYTAQKLNGEKIVKNGVSFRLGKLFGKKSSKQNKLTEHIILNDEIWLDEVLFNPTSVKQVLTIVNFELINNNLNGIYNLSNKGFTSHYNYGLFINGYLKSKKIIHKTQKINRKFHNYGKFIMSTKKLEKFCKLTDWETDLRIYLDELNS